LWTPHVPLLVHPRMHSPKCLYTLSWARNINVFGWGNGMILELWGKPRSSQNMVSWTINSTNGYTRQHFGARLDLILPCMVFHFQYAVHFLPPLTTLGFGNLKLRHSSSTLP
jgi:hypothetical protein